MKPAAAAKTVIPNILNPSLYPVFIFLLLFRLKGTPLKPTVVYLFQYFSRSKSLKEL